MNLIRIDDDLAVVVVIVIVYHGSLLQVAQDVDGAEDARNV